MIYTGIGSRKIPKDVCVRMTKWGEALAEIDFVLRSGAAAGADSAFERGCDRRNGKKEIFLPWQGFRYHKSNLYNIPPEAYELAADVYGSGWLYIKQTTRMLMARNILQVLGMTLDIPSHFILAWTPDGCETAKRRTKRTGGTGQAIEFACEMNIPVFNLKNPDADKRAQSFIQEMLDNE